MDGYVVLQQHFRDEQCRDDDDFQPNQCQDLPDGFHQGSMFREDLPKSDRDPNRDLPLPTTRTDPTPMTDPMPTMDPSPMTKMDPNTKDHTIRQCSIRRILYSKPTDHSSLYNMANHIHK